MSLLLRLYKLPPQLHAMLGMDSIASYDVVEAKRYEQTLSQPGNYQHRDISVIIGSFEQWRSQYSGSFAAQIGRRLDTTIQELNAEAQQWKTRAEQLRQQRRQGPKTFGTLVRILQWLGYVTFWSWAAFIVMWQIFRSQMNEFGQIAYGWVRAFDMSETTTKAIFLGVWFVLWLLLYLIQVALETRDEIRVLNRRRTIISDIEAAEKNYYTCLEAQERVRIGYQQFVALSHQLGAVMEQPFGTVRQYRVDNVIPANDMPQSVVLAEAAPQEAAIAELARDFRSELYYQGWLEEHVQEARGVAKQLIEQENGNQLRTEHMHSLMGRGSGTALDTIGQCMASKRFNELDRSANEWAGFINKLKAEVRRKRSQILQPLRITQGSRKTEAPKLQPLEETAQLGSFNAEFINPMGVVNDVAKVDQAYLQEGGSELDAIGVSEILVQVSKPAKAEHINVARPVAIGDYDSAPDAPPVVPPSSEEDWGLPTTYQIPNSQPRSMPGDGEF